MVFRCLLPFTLLLTACGTSTPSGHSAAASGDSTITKGNIPAGDFYGRYSGTVAGKPVVVQLHRFGHTVRGSYQYTAVGEAIELQNYEDTTADNTFYLTEIVHSGRQNDSNAHWTLQWAGNTATGAWQSADGKRTYDIRLVQEYPAGSVALGALYKMDSAALQPGKKGPQATASYAALLPPDTGKSAAFVATVLRKTMGISGTADIPAGVAELMRKYFADYRQEVGDVTVPDSEANAPEYAYTSDDAVYVLYNDAGWLVLEEASADYTGGAHGNYGSTFQNADVQQGKIWTLADMVTDTTALRPMLNDAAIAYFGLKPGQGMGEYLLVDAVPPTDNVYLSSGGLTFVYNPYEIASYADGEIRLFLPFAKLMPLLTPAFKARMALAGRAGVAMR